MNTKRCTYKLDSSHWHPLYCLSAAQYDPQDGLYHCRKGHAEPHALSLSAAVLHFWPEIMVLAAVAYFFFRS